MHFCLWVGVDGIFVAPGGDSPWWLLHVGLGVIPYALAVVLRDGSACRDLYEK